MSSGQSREKRRPETISLAAAATTAGVKRFSIPNWSASPNLPHAFPGGPLTSSGSDEKGGCGGSKFVSETLFDDMEVVSEVKE